MWDVAIVGAGLTGLTCAQILHRQGYQVLVLEKSRGLGGRIATRRLHDTCADHGVRYLEPFAANLHQLIQDLLSQELVQRWDYGVYSVDGDGNWQPIAPSLPRYIAPKGISAVVQPLAMGLEIWRQRRVSRLIPNHDHWHIHLEVGNATEAVPYPLEVTARAVVSAIPAPQALDLLTPLATDSTVATLIDRLRPVSYDPCLAVIAGYAPDQASVLTAHHADWGAIARPDHPVLAWIGWDSRKRPHPPHPVLMIHSTPAYAQAYLEAPDLQPVALELLHSVQEQFPELAPPQWWQIHRWRYAIPQTAILETALAAELPAAIVLGGDWCGGNLIESALISGNACAERVKQMLP